MFQDVSCMVIQGMGGYPLVTEYVTTANSDAGPHAEAEGESREKDPRRLQVL